jgi:hypothetical protein
MRKEIPKIIQIFSEVISDNMLYADKTEYIWFFGLSHIQGIKKISGIHRIIF